MYFIPLCLFLSDPTSAGALSWSGFLYNLLPVTLDNLVGGAGMVGLVYWRVYRAALQREPSQRERGEDSPSVSDLLVTLEATVHAPVRPLAPDGEPAAISTNARSASVNNPEHGQLRRSGYAGRKSAEGKCNEVLIESPMLARLADLGLD